MIEVLRQTTGSKPCLHKSVQRHEANKCAIIYNWKESDFPRRLFHGLQQRPHPLLSHVLYNLRNVWAEHVMQCSKEHMLYQDWMPTCIASTALVTLVQVRGLLFMTSSIFVSSTCQ